MIEVRNVSGTAFVVAEFRADENSRVNPLYRDSVVSLFLSEESRQAAERVERNFPLAKDLVKIRTKYLDDMLVKQIRGHVRQVVILGAGLDTRAVRKPASGVMYFEIDDPGTLQLKQDRYEQHGFDVDVTFIPGNYVTDGLIPLLKRSGFDFDLPTYFIWEGNTMYLPLQSDKDILRQLRQHVNEFRVSFDYMAEAVISRTTGDLGVTKLVESFENMGAPWLTGFNDIHSLAHELRLNVVENFKTAELRRLYHMVPSTSPIFNFYSICTLEV